MLDAFIFPTVYDALKCDSDISDVAADALSPILLQCPVDNYLLTHLSRLRRLLCDGSSPRIICRLLPALDSLEPDRWFDDLYAMLWTVAECDNSEIRNEFPALAAKFLGRLHEREHRVRILSLVSSLKVSDYTMRVALSAHLPAMSAALDANDRAVLIPPIATALFGENMEELGPVIGTIGAHVDKEIVMNYCAALTSKSPNVMFRAAFAFSAVAVALGRERWREISAAFDTARHASDMRVRRTLAFALASFAFAIPRHDLEHKAVDFLMDTQDVAEGVIVNLDQIARLIPNPRRLLFALQEPDVKYKQWRVRLAVSRQLRYCADIFGKDQLRAVAFKLAVDPIAAVRVDAAYSAASLADSNCANVLQRMATDGSHIVRQAAARICRNLAPERRAECVHIIKTLAKDSVPNVRVHAAEALVETVRDGPGNAEIRALLEEVRQDKDLDVRKAAMGNDCVVSTNEL
jgi:HEAT repeat protein